MYKVFVNHKEIILTSKPPGKYAEKSLSLKSTSLKKIIHIIFKTKVKTLYLIHPKSKKLISTFKKKIPVIIAAGGVVQHNNGKLLFIYRKNRWDLPKGKVEVDETLEHAAEREVFEETGVKNLIVGGLAGITYHIFKRNNGYQLKETYWYMMSTNFVGNLTPETQEDITKVVWKGKLKTQKALKRTYPNIDELFKNSIMKTLFAKE
jgi:ADP-ribose pyrophosphatase YjhB (NUDIX family)